MILGDASPASPAAAAAPTHRASAVTIDAIFRRLVKRRPDALALVDADNRESFTAGEPRRLTYAEADRTVAAIAGRLRSMGLPTDAIVGVQLPNIAENILTILGILRAGMIVAPLPLLWRQADAVAALGRIGAKALITCGRVGAFNHCQFAMAVAADVFSIRYVCGFGNDLPDGVVPFDELFNAPRLEPAPLLERGGHDNAAKHVAAVTFDVVDGGGVPAARNHAELLAGGLAVVLEGRLAEDTNIVSAIAPTSFAGICLTLFPWLLCGGTLVLHHPFDAGVLIRQRRQYGCGTLVLPAPVAIRLADTSAFAVENPTCVIAAWHSPEQIASAPLWREPGSSLVDVAIFGEVALIPARRDISGKPPRLATGAIVVPQGGPDGSVVAELMRTDAGTVALRGPMVPHHPFPPGIEDSGLPYFKIGPKGVVDSGYTCRGDTLRNAIVVTGPPVGIVSVGGYRFLLRNLQDAVRRVDGAATLAALPDPVTGRRLIGNATNRSAMQAMLNAAGVNPLVVAAFADRSGQDVSAA